MKPMLSSAALKGVAELTEQYGYCADNIALRAGMDPTALYRTELMVSTRSFNGLLEEAAAVCKERFFGVKLAQMQGAESLHPLLQSTIKIKAHAVSEVVNYLSKNIELISQQLSSTVVKGNSGITFCFEVRRVSTEGKILHHSLIQATEHLMCHCCYILQQVLGRDWRPTHTQFRHADPGKRSALKKVFGVNLYFNQDINAILLSNEQYNQPLSAASNTDYPNADDKTGNIEAGIPFIIKVNRTIVQLINTGPCTLNKVADDLAINRRTLQYRLRKNKTSYQALYDSSRFELARQYLLQSKLSVIELAERLNFSDAPTFCHFFKKRTGHSPKRYVEHVGGLL
tara:strand:+ start:564 stop:1589 length:1026 start_codon:yes stop_codon:yes gene_type:complete